RTRNTAISRGRLAKKSETRYEHQLPRCESRHAGASVPARRIASRSPSHLLGTASRRGALHRKLRWWGFTVEAYGSAAGGQWLHGESFVDHHGTGRLAQMDGHRRDEPEY